MISYEISGATITLKFYGAYNNRIKKREIATIERIFHDKNLKNYLIFLESQSTFDISFLIFLSGLLEYLEKNGKNYRISTQDVRILDILKQIRETKQTYEILPKERALKRFLRYVGVRLWEATNAGIDFVNFVGKLLYYLSVALVKPRLLRHRAISYHIYHGVITAMPIIFIVSFIVGGVIAYQGGVTLQRMGFPGATVEMTAKLTLREIGPFVVALIVAGRSASSYTAQIGVMKMTEELDAMKTMDFNLFHFIVLPRFIALVVSFPLMVFLSDLISIFGCMVFLKYGFEITFMDYIAQLKDFVGLHSFWVGVIKAPFYAATIVLIGCFIGFRVEANTQSVGEKTTTSVVYALFGVILVNALFSLIFTELKF